MKGSIWCNQLINLQLKLQNITNHDDKLIWKVTMLWSTEKGENFYHILTHSFSVYIILLSLFYTLLFLLLSLIYPTFLSSFSPCHFPFNHTYHFLPLKLLYSDYFIPFNPYFSIYEYRENSFFFFLETFSFHSQSHPLSCANEVLGRGGGREGWFSRIFFFSLCLFLFFWWIIFRRNEMGYDKNFFYL